MRDGIISLIISYVVKIFIMSNEHVEQFRAYVYANNSDTLQLDRTFALFEFAIQIVIFCIVYFFIYLIKYHNNKNKPL